METLRENGADETNWSESSPFLCSAGPEVFPIYTYSHDLGSFISVTGGVIYRGEEIPHLNGHYIFADLSLR